MVNNPPSDGPLALALAEIARLRRFPGSPTEFWPAFLAAAAALSGAAKAVLILKDPNPPNAWKKLGEWTGGSHADRVVLNFTRQLADIAENCARLGGLILPIEDSAQPGLKRFAVATQLQMDRPQDVCIAAFLVMDIGDEQAREVLTRLRLVSDTPSSYLANQAVGQSKADADKFASSLDIMVLINDEKKFLGATLALCNAVATRFQCDRASFGWLENGYVRLKSISRTERFDKNMAAVKALEVLMEESFDQDDEIIWPAPEGSTFVSRDHEAFSRGQSVTHILSIPLRLDSKPLGVLTCERESKPFSLPEIRQLRLACDQTARRLDDLKRVDGWLGARLATQAREKLATVLGPEHTWVKVAGICCVLLLALLFFGRFNYRVEGNFILKSDDVSFLTSPFEGYIKEVGFRPGDTVNTNSVLVRLNTDELLLEEISSMADQTRYLREAEKARATNALAEMRIASALVKQSEAKLELIRHRIGQASIRPPFNGVVVEGDLRERLGAPVKQGDALIKVARLDTMYVEAHVNQRDIHEITANAKGEIAFVTQPRFKFPVVIERIEPAAFPKEGENLFMVRLRLLGPPEVWWRPGMSGLCKLEAGKRSLFWILTHRTVDFLRMQLWW